MKQQFHLIPSDREKPCPHRLVAYSGRVPCTGPLRCSMCGEEVNQMDYPEHVARDVETPIGNFKLISWGDQIILNPPDHVGGTKPGNVTINGVEYTCYTTFRITSDGRFVADDYRSITLQRWNSAKAYDYTSAALRKAKEGLTEWINKYVAEHPEIVHEGRIAQAKTDLYYATKRLEEAEQKRHEEQAKYEAARRRLREVSA